MIFVRCQDFRVERGFELKMEILNSNKTAKVVYSGGERQYSLKDNKAIVW